MNSNFWARRYEMTEFFKCPNCTTRDPIPPSAESCPSCGTQVPPPNVRSANLAAEIMALDERYDRALKLADAAGSSTVLLEFKQAIDSSNAVLSRYLPQVAALIRNKENYRNFYLQLKSGERSPEANRFDKRRQIADQAVFPYYYENIVFAALSLDAFGLRNYGQCGIVFKEDTIRHRATVFEENTTEFCVTHDIGARNPDIPNGYRASWERRATLACAKLFPVFKPDTTRQEFSTILLKNDENRSKDQFIEVNIYGMFNYGSIQTISAREINSPADKVILKQLKKDAEKLGIDIIVQDKKVAKAA